MRPDHFNGFLSFSFCVIFPICLTKVILEANYAWENLLLSQGHQGRQKKGGKINQCMSAVLSWGIIKAGSGNNVDIKRDGSVSGDIVLGFLCLECKTH